MNDDKIVNAGYVIEQEVHISNAVIVLGVNPDLLDKEHTTPYVTWETDKDKKDFYWGHYFKDRYSAERDLVKEVTKRFGTLTVLPAFTNSRRSVMKDEAFFRI